MISGKDVDPTAHTILGLIGALLAGLSSAFIAGDVHAKFDPTGRLGSLSVEAAGGVALFVIVLGWWRSDRGPIKPRRIK